MLKIILSQSFESLAKCLSAALEERQSKFLMTTIFVPHVSVKQSLQVILASNNSQKVIAGCKITTIDEFLHLKFPAIATQLELRAAVYQALYQETDSSLQSFLQNDSQKLCQLTESLSSIFYAYSKGDVPNFEKISHPSSYWQSKIFAKIFLDGPFKILKNISKDLEISSETVHFFGFSYLLNPYLELISSQKNAIFYGFSPCYHFWQDTLSKKQEAKFFHQALKKNVSDLHLQDAKDLFSATPPLLASFGKIGKDFFSNFDMENSDVEMVFSPILYDSVLGKLQKEIVTFERQDFQTVASDDSIKILKTGSSKLQQVISLKEEILSLCYNKGLKFSDIVVLSPNIEDYTKHIEYVFNQASIAYRFCHVSLEKQSSYYLAVCDLVELIKNPISAPLLKNLLQRPSFYLKMGLCSDDVEKCNLWLEKIFQKSTSFKEGVTQFYTQSLQLYANISIDDKSAIKSFAYKVDLSIQDLDLFELFVGSFLKLIEKIESFKPLILNLSVWADLWQSLVSDFLQASDSAIEMQAMQAVEGSIKNLRSSFVKLPDVQVPHEIIEKTLLQGVKTDLYASNLQSVTFSQIQEGSIPTVNAILLLGMDEESFPQKQTKISLDFSQNFKLKANLDRYLFLQIILNAKKFLRIFYNHISPVDGKKIGPSMVVQELIKAVFQKHTEECFSFSVEKPQVSSLYSFSKTNIEKKNRKIAVSDLTSFAKNPWKYFLRKHCQIYIQDSSDRSFAASRSLMMNQGLCWPMENVLDAKKPYYPEKIDEAFCVDVLERKRLLQKALNSWSQKLEPLILLQSKSNTQSYCNGVLQCPSIEMDLDLGFKVEIVGEIYSSLPDGYLHLGDDSISSCLRLWPEILVSLVAKNKNQIFFAKNLKTKTVGNPQKALKDFLHYFLAFENSLSPLHPNFAEMFLRNKIKGLDWDMEFLDPSDKWLVKRLEKVDFSVLLNSWTDLKAFFPELIELYPVRGVYEEV